MASTTKVLASAGTVCGLVFGFYVGVVLLSQSTSLPLHTEKLQFIVDTDVGPWPDDVGAFSMLHSFADQGLLDIVAIMANNKYEGVVGVIDAMNTYFNRSSIPIGLTRDPNANASVGMLGWPEYVLTHFPHPKYTNNSQAEDAVTLYRKILSRVADKSITILSIGYLNNLANLLKTSGDQYSNASGIDLIRSKVKHMFVMAGKYPTGEELNIRDQISAARAALPHWPTSATFIGYESGEYIQCGGNLLNSTTNSSILAHSPVSKAFEFAFKFFGHIDGCFDETATLVAVRGLTPHYDPIPGVIEIFVNGTNGWHNDVKGQQVYVKQKATVSNQTIVNEINPLLFR